MGMVDTCIHTGEAGDDSRERREPWAPNLGTRDLVSLSNGVFAVAMTLLVFQLSIPEFGGSTSNTTQVTSFLDMAGEFYIYVLSFLVLGIYWILYHYMFHFIKRSNGVLIWINIAILILVTLVPFSAAVLRENTTLIPGERSDSNAPYAFFSGTTMMTILLLLGMWQYATGGSRLVEPDIDQRVVSALRATILIGTAVTLAGFLLSFYVPIASLLGFVAMFFMIAMTAYARHGIVS
jgi:uncharacterized membrane protein